MSFGSEPEKAEMQLFISHSSKHREWVEPVCRRIEASGFRAHLAEYDLAGLGHELNSNIQDAIKASLAGRCHSLEATLAVDLGG